MSADLLIKRMLETMPNCVIVDKDGFIVYMNQVYARLLGLEAPSVTGRHVTDIIPGTKMPEIISSGKPETGQIMRLYDHKQKKEVDLICNRFPLLDDQGHIIGAAAITTFEDLEDINRMHIELSKVREENESYRQTIQQLTGGFLKEIIGTSRQIMEIKQTIAEFAATGLTIMLTGETGVGKEVFANAIQKLSKRKDRPFIKINCAAIPGELLESELFGYEEGAFTGAKKGGRPGRFELANGGTLLLDEIGEMPLPLQAKLLRVLQEKEVERLGGGRPQKIDVRIICSTNVDIRQMVSEKQFREDLYYRLNTVELTIPPLRDRPGDIPLLCYHFIRKINAEHDMNVIGIEDEVIELFQNYSWPGNVRELEHVIERLAVKSKNDIIRIRDCGFLISRMLPQKAVRQETSSTGSDRTPRHLLKDVQGLSEKEAILDALKHTGGNRKKAAAVLGISRSSLYNKLNKYQIDS